MNNLFWNFILTFLVPGLIVLVLTIKDEGLSGLKRFDFSHLVVYVFSFVPIFIYFIVISLI